MRGTFEKETIKIMNKRIFFIIFFFALYLVAIPNKTFAASIFFDPGSVTVGQGDIFSVNIVTNSEGVAINNADATINFPSDIVEVQSISKSGSIFTLWVEEPTFSNNAGTITLNGGVPNPGFVGARGKIISVVFRAKKPGSASLLFSSAAVRANDGIGTNVLSSRQPGSVLVSSVVVIPVVVPPPSQGALPRLPIITSTTNPSQNEWYRDPRASFSWSIPSGVTSIQTILSKSPTAVPSVSSDSSVSQKTFSQIADGVQYFRIRFINSEGTGPSAQYKIQIDSTAPDSFDPKITQNEVRHALSLSARDTVSGIDQYVVTNQDGSVTIIKPSELVDDSYTLPVTQKGKQSISVVAIDKAGNATNPIALSYEASEISIPIISIEPDEVLKRERVVVSGITAYPNTDVVVYVNDVKNALKQYPLTTLPDGSFSFKSDELSVVGRYSVWAELVFSDAIKSDISEKKTVLVNETELVRLSRAVIYRLILIMIIVILFLIILFTSYLGWHKYFGLKKKFNDEIDEVSKSVHDSLSFFKEELANQLGILEKTKVDRNLNRKEQKIFKELEKNIDTIDKFIEGKLKKIK